MFSVIVFGQSILIGLYDRYEVKSYELTPVSGDYTIHADSVTNVQVSPGTIIKIDHFRTDSLRLHVESKYYGAYASINIHQDSLNSVMQVQSLSPSIKKHTFHDNFNVTARNGKVILVNNVSMTNYLSGVIESEGGGGKHLEYYKVQALISRTYALKNIDRHKSQGFNLCDAVHCQAYHNMMRFTPKIEQAVKETKGEVFVDGEYNLMSTYFHANCGGQTSDASYVWKNTIPYCVPFVDTFCIHTRQSNWEKRIPKSEWEGFLTKMYGLDLKNPLVRDNMYAFNQEYRKAFYIHPSLGVPLRDLRMEFKLKSTFFDVHREGSYVVLNGHGFGHGIGLCQEGAMEMANQGYSYKQIGLYYFDGIKIIDYNELMFYREKMKATGF